jgi:cbb3-type cytochrome oxidase subunit 3
MQLLTFERGDLLVLALVGAAALARVLGLPGLAAALVALALMLLAIGGWWAFRTRARRPADGGFPYVLVEDDGGARELAADEREHVLAEFHPGDGGRPYIKSCYASRTPDGRLAGYLPRRQLPPRIPIRPAP